MPQANNASSSSKSRADGDDPEDTAAMMARLLGASSELNAVLPPLTAKLQAREARLDARERELNKRERDLQKREREVERHREQGRGELRDLQRQLSEQGTALQKARDANKELRTAQDARPTQDARVAQKETGTAPTPVSAPVPLQALARATATALIRAGVAA